MSIYFDASFLVSSYSADSNSPSVLSVMQNAKGILLITSLAELEFRNALALRVFRKSDSPLQSRASLGAFEQDIRDGIFEIRHLPENVFLRATELSDQTTRRLGTRASDILHVAAALELGAVEFYTFDRQQGKLAKEMKLTINLFH